MVEVNNFWSQIYSVFKLALQVAKKLSFLYLLQKLLNCKWTPIGESDLGYVAQQYLLFCTVSTIRSPTFQ